MIQTNNNTGFTLIELVVVMVIIGILSIIGIPIYQQYVKNAMIAEGKGLVSAVAQAENMYYLEGSRFYSTFGGAQVENDPILAVDATMNKYFRTYGVNTANAGQTFIITASGIDTAAGIDIVFNSDPDNNGRTDGKGSITVSGI